MSDIKKLGIVLGSKVDESPFSFNDYKKFDKLRIKMADDGYKEHIILPAYGKCYFQYKDETRNFYDKLKLHNIRFIDEKMPKNIHHLDKLESELHIINPLDMGIVFTNNENLSSMIIPIVSDEELAKYNPIFSNAHLNNIKDAYSTIYYAGEVARSQVEDKKYMIEDINDENVLPLLMSFIMASEVDRRLLIKYQIYNLKKLYTYLFHVKTAGVHRLSDNMEIVSILKALDMFSVYDTSDELIKKEMIKDIQKVFDGELSVELLMAKYDVSLNKAIDINNVRGIVRSK